MTDPHPPIADPVPTVRLASIADIHCTVGSRGALRRLFHEMADVSDILTLCGDLTQTGSAAEARILAEELSAAAPKPVLAVLGNHDYQAGQLPELLSILADAGVHVLDGQFINIQGVGFVGVKGFGGGFHGKMLIRWGEEVIKQFVQEAVSEARKLDHALSQLNTPQRVVLLHYAPIRATVVGESPEIFPFCGSSHLEGPLNRHPVVAALHGHAHHGAPQGFTSAGVPVYNVSEPLLRRITPDRPFHLLSIPLRTASPTPQPAMGDGR